MSMNPMTDARFEIDFADRMSKALRYSGLGVQEIAEGIQVSRNTVSSWINGRHKPRRRDLVAFALATGYPVEWLETGEAPHDGGTSPDGLSRLSESNRRPSHYKAHTLADITPIGVAA